MRSAAQRALWRSRILVRDPYVLVFPPGSVWVQTWARFSHSDGLPLKDASDGFSFKRWPSQKDPPGKQMTKVAWMARTCYVELCPTGFQHMARSTIGFMVFAEEHPVFLRIDLATTPGRSQTL